MNPDSTVPPVKPSDSQSSPSLQEMPLKGSGALPLLGFLLSIFMAPAGLIISIIVLREMHKQKLKGRKLAIAGIIIGSALTLTFVIVAGFVGYAIYSISGGGHDNQAQVDLQPILTQVQKLGGKPICDNGDNGYTLDNSQPWYESYYTIPVTPDLTSEIKDIASSQGYTLSVDTGLVNQTNQNTSTTEQHNSASDYLIWQHNGAELDVTINRNTSVALYCNSGTYGRLQKTGGGAIIDFSMSLPPTNR